MNFAQLKNSLLLGAESSIYLLEGEDTFFLERGLLLIKKQFLIDQTLDYAEFSGDAPISEIESSLYSYPFMGGKRITVVKEFYLKAENIKGDFKTFLEKPESQSVLVIVNTKPSEVLKKYQSVAVVDCNKADSGTIVKWIKATMAQNNVNIEGETASLICEYCQNDMTRIATEVEKLISYGLKDGVISKEDVENLVSRDVEYKIYELTDLIGRKKCDKALTMVSEMLSKGETEQRLLSSMYNYFRRLLFSAISDMTEEQLAKTFGVKEFAVKKMKEQANLFKKRSLKNAVDMLSDMDYKIKSGAFDAGEQLYVALFKIMTE